MKRGEERQPGNAKAAEGERGGGGSVRKVGMKGCEESAVPGIESERGSVVREEERRGEL